MSQQATAERLSQHQQLFDHSAMERATLRIVNSSKQLLQEVTRGQVYAQTAAEARKACWAACVVAERHGYGKVQIRCLEWILPADVALAVGAYAEAVRRLDAAWKAQDDTPITDAISDAYRAVEELAAIMKVKGYLVQ